MNDSKYYFAYGSNMDTESFLMRCRGAKLIGGVSLYGWKLKCRHYADIEPERFSFVWGVVYEVTDEDISILDRYECYPTLYQKFFMEANVKGLRCNVFFYTMTDEYVKRFDNVPMEKRYMRTCREGAIANGIPIDDIFIEDGI